MKYKSSFNFGWIVVGTSFITLALAYGVMYSFSVFFVALLKEFSWSRSIGAGAFSLFIILHGMIGPIVGGIVDRFGSRRVILLGSLFMGTGLALCSITHTWWQFYLFFGAITALGVGATGWVPHTTMIHRWFKKKRGLAMGIISSGIGIGILVCLPFIQYLINRVGWRMTYRIMAFFIPLIIISTAISFLKKPLQINSSRHSEREISSKVIQDSFAVDEGWVSSSWTIRRAITTKQFWYLSLSFFLGSFVSQSILIHHVAFFVDQGLEALFASYIAGMVGIVSIGGKILWGTISDKIGREVTYTIGIICSMLGMIILILFNIFPYLGLTYLYSMFFGLGYAVTATLPPLITADFFEGQTYGRIFGTLIFVNNIGGATGAWFAGFLYDQVGSYIPAFIILIVCAIFACLSLWKAAPRKVRRVPGKR